MKYTILTDSFDSTWFNTVARHPLQTWEWGEARKETGQEVIRIGEFENDNLANVFTITLHRIPKSSYRIGYCARSLMPSKELLTFLTDFGKKEQLILIKFEPDVIRRNSNFEFRISNFRKSPTPLFPIWTQILDISPSEEELLKGLKSKTRYNIRYAEKNNVMVEEDSTDQGFEKFSKLYFKTVDRQTYHGHDKTYHRIVWDHLKHGIAHILIAKHDDTPLAAYELFYFQNVLYYPYGGSSDEKRNLMASNLLMWEAIRLGKKLGATRFDMWGSLPPGYDTTSEWAGFTRFKEGYGTDFVELIGSYDLVINPLLYPIYNLVYKIRDFLLRARVL